MMCHFLLFKTNIFYEIHLKITGGLYPTFKNLRISKLQFKPGHLILFFF